MQDICYNSVVVKLVKAKLIGAAPSTIKDINEIEDLIYEVDKKYKPLQGAYNTVDSDIVPEEIKKSQKKEKNYDIEPGHLPQAEVIYSPAQVISMKDAGEDGFQVVPMTQNEGYISA